jgi:hypothetical protein
MMMGGAADRDSSRANSISTMAMGYLNIGWSVKTVSTTLTLICRSIKDSLDLSGQHTPTLAFSRRSRKMIVEFYESQHFMERCPMHVGSHR